MRTILSVVAAFIMSASAFAAVPLIDDELETYDFRACDYWGSINSNSGNFYACQFYPARVQVPTANDTVRVFNQLITQINALEERLKKLEESALSSPN